MPLSAASWSNFSELLTKKYDFHGNNFYMISTSLHLGGQ